MQTSFTLEQRDPTALRLHKSLKNQPGAWAEDDPRFEALCDDIGARGIDQPLLITRHNEIADGRNRWRAAKQQQLPSVPVRVIDDADVPTVIVQSLLQRRHYTPGQRAYLLAPSLEAAFADAYQRMISGKPTPPSELSSEGLTTLEKWAREIGVSDRYLRTARKIWEHFQDDAPRKFGEGKSKTTATFREYYEPLILDAEDPMGLGEVMKGIGFDLSREKKGGDHKGGRPDKEADRLRLFNRLADDEDNRWEYWPKLSDDAKKEHFEHIRAKAARIDDAAELEARAEYHERVAKEFRKATKQAATAKGEK